MSETRGYPNPNYTEDDILTEKEAMKLEAGLVPVFADHYEELVSKAAALDILTAQIRATGEINETVVRAITGTLDCSEMVPKTEADSYWGYYMKEKKKTDEMSLRLVSLEKANSEMREILRQNNIGEWGQKEEQKEDA